MEREECAVQAHAADAKHASAARRQKRLQKSITQKQRTVEAARWVACGHLLLSATRLHHLLEPFMLSIPPEQGSIQRLGLDAL